MTDIVERMIREARWIEGDQLIDSSALLREAADEIERLRMRVWDLEGKVNRWRWLLARSPEGPIYGLGMS